MQVTRVFIGPLMNVAMSTKAFANGVILITVVLHIANQIQEVFERSDFQTSLAFLEYRRFEARRAVVCSLSAYKEPKLPGTSSTGRTLYAFYSRCKISASEARKERKISIFWVKKSWHFYLLLSLPSPPPASFFFFLVQFFGPGSLLGLISMGNVLENSRAYGIRRKEVQLGT